MTPIIYILYIYQKMGKFYIQIWLVQLFKVQNIDLHVGLVKLF